MIQIREEENLNLNRNYSIGWLDRMNQTNEEFNRAIIDWIEELERGQKVFIQKIKDDSTGVTEVKTILRLLDRLLYSFNEVLKEAVDSLEKLRYSHEIKSEYRREIERFKYQPFN